MAHTLKAYYYTDPATAVTVDFMGAIADNDGIAVDSWEMGIPGVEQARNNSLYSDSPRPVYSRHSTVTDSLTVTVRGSTNTALYTNLHLLAKLGEYARIGTQNPYVKATPYLEMKPGGSSAGEVLYAPIYDCRVQLPPNWALSQDATLTIEDVTVTIERGLWQAYAPAGSASANLAASSQTTSGGAASSADVGGDTSALYRVQLAIAPAGYTVNRVIIGFRSKMLGGANYASLGKKEAESQTNGTDTTDAVDATASAGNKVACTFVTGTLATRLSGTDIPYGTHRVFARMKANGTQVATVNIKYQDYTGTNVVYAVNASVSVSSTTWYVYDLGIVRYYETGLGGILDTSSTGVWALDASGTPAAGNLDIDYLFFMPTEGYLTASGFAMTYTGISQFNILEFNTATYPGTFVTFYEVGVSKRIASLTYTASHAPPPGAFACYWLFGTDTGSVFDCNINDIAVVQVSTNPRFLMPSVV